MDKKFNINLTIDGFDNLEKQLKKEMGLEIIKEDKKINYIIIE